jgi:hypothetical protein
MKMLVERMSSDEADITPIGGPAEGLIVGYTFNLRAHSGHHDVISLEVALWPSDDEVGILTDAFKYCKPVEVSMNEKTLSIKAVGDEEDRKEGEG